MEQQGKCFRLRQEMCFIYWYLSFIKKSGYLHSSWSLAYQEQAYLNLLYSFYVSVTSGSFSCREKKEAGKGREKNKENV